MQRWWFLDDKDKSCSTSEYSVPSTVVEHGEKDRCWTFRVLVTRTLCHFEGIAMTGDCTTLGNWIPQQCVFLKNEDDSNIWTCDVAIPLDKNIAYRFFIYSIDPATQYVHVRRWETHLVPRQISAFAERHPDTIDTLGIVDGLEKLDCGWLITETVLQFKFYNNPFHSKHKLKDRLLYVKLTPLNLRCSETSSMSTQLEESMSNDTRDTGTEQPTYAFAEVVTLKYPTCSIETQSQFGRAYNPGEFLIFNVTVAEPDNVAYLIDLYTYSSRVAPDGSPYHLGYHYILPNVLRKTTGELELPITCASRHRPLGLMNVEYLKISPFKSNRLTMEHSYIRYWNEKWKGLDVGHRGLGNSFKPTGGTNIRENTIASLKSAVSSGADMVEFDVQLSKDLIPVIYHDFHVCVSLKRKNLVENDMLELPMKELTQKQLKNLKVYHVVEGRNRAAKFFDEDLDDHQPFPLLADALESIDMSVGFNIEIKWSMKLKDGSIELDQTTDANKYLDTILNVVFAKVDARRIVFSCFDPDICTMLRYKQNIYPVMFLTNGITERYPEYHDVRCNTVEMSIANAYAMELLGVVAHTEDLLRDSTRIKTATDLGLVMFCWGDENNDLDTITLLKNLGIHGVIYDKIDILSTKTIKKSIFLIDAEQSQRHDLLRLRIRNKSTNKKKDTKHHPYKRDNRDGLKGSTNDICEIEKIEQARDEMALSTASSLESLEELDVEVNERITE